MNFFENWRGLEDQKFELTCATFSMNICMYVLIWMNDLKLEKKRMYNFNYLILFYSELSWILNYSKSVVILKKKNFFLIFFFLKIL